MAIVQISQIQIRRGLQQDLPQLASAEMGWSLDQRRLYIGNGTLAEGAPTEGVTEILTQYSNFLSTIPNYTFVGTDSGYTSQTGASSLSPITRTLQSVLDDIVTVRDFGAVGNGTTDDTAAINRAISQVYKDSLNGLHSNVQRTIKIPAGTYLVSGPIYLPPNCTLIGDGKNNTVIKSTTDITILKTCDSLFQFDGGIGNAGAIYPSYIFVGGIKLQKTTGTNPVVVIDSAFTVALESVYFLGTSTITNLVTTASTRTAATDVTFNRCVFDNGVNGYTATGTTDGVRIKDSTFKNNSGSGINVTSSVTGLLSSGNYFFAGLFTPIAGLSGNNYSVGDTMGNSTTEGGIYSGTAKIGSGNTWVLSSGTNTITQLTIGAGAMDYQLTDGVGNFRYGTLKFNNSVGRSTFDDDFTEPGSSLGANLFVNYNGTLSCTVSNTTTFKYNIKQFV